MRCPRCEQQMVPGRFTSHPESRHVQAFGPFGLPLAFTSREGGLEKNRFHVCVRCQYRRS